MRCPHAGRDTLQAQGHLAERALQTAWWAEHWAANRGRQGYCVPQRTEAECLLVGGFRTVRFQAISRDNCPNLPGDLKTQIEAFLEHYSHHRYHDSLAKLVMGSFAGK